VADKTNLFEIKDRDAAGRLGVFHTNHGEVETPALLPVINPNIEDGISPEELKERFGAQILITNSYIIYKNEDLRKKALDNGLHSLLGFDGAIWTDSGTFQLYTYGDIDVEPETIVEFQRDMGSDILTMLDLFTKPDEDPEKARADIEENVLRARKAAELKGNSALAGTVQGGVFPELRTECAQRMSEIACDVHPIGGVVPLMENYRYKTLAEVIISARKGLDPGRPMHLFGAGHPMVFPLAAALGCDMFDSASYAKYASQNRMMFDNGTRHLEDLEYLPCSCPVCSSTTSAELLSLDANERTRQLSLHNLYVCYAMIDTIKQAMVEGSLWELVERTCSAHPKLLEALPVIRDNAEYLVHSADRTSEGTGTGSSTGTTSTKLSSWYSSMENTNRRNPTAGH
jgi:7-cyano-7-deazaguanine tRNA-ribosyltransferase